MSTGAKVAIWTAGHRRSRDHPHVRRPSAPEEFSSASNSNPGDDVLAVASPCKARSPGDRWRERARSNARLKPRAPCQSSVLSQHPDRPIGGGDAAELRFLEERQTADVGVREDQAIVVTRFSA